MSLLARWRLDLARVIFQRDPHLTESALREATHAALCRGLLGQATGLPPGDGLPAPPPALVGITAEGLGEAWEEALGRAVGLVDGEVVERRSGAREDQGAWYTPREVAAQLAAEVTPQGRVLDPACGAGALLVAVYRRLLQGGSAPRAELATCLYGVDVDPEAVEITRVALLLVLLEEPVASLPTLNLRCADAVGEERGAWAAWFPEVFDRPRPGFDVVIGNPPYLSAGVMAARAPARRAAYSARYATATGSWDLYCLFIELAVGLTRDGGRHAFLVPNKLASAGYARATRALLAQAGALRLVRDGSGTPVFRALVYVLLYVLEKGSANPAGQQIFPSDGAPWTAFGDDPLAARALPTLGERAEVLGAATVAEAYALAPLLTSCATPAAGDLRVVNSGTVDRHVTRWGERPMRYLRRSLPHPVVRTEDQAALPPLRLQQARTPKIIVAGMTRVIEAALDAEGAFLAAKSTTIVLAPPDELPWIAAVLNSALMTRVFCARFGGLRLGDGYLRIGPPQLRALPLPRVETAAQRAAAAALGQAWLRLLRGEEREEVVEAGVVALFGDGTAPQGR
jgi:hypothetical protein